MCHGVIRVVLLCPNIQEVCTTPPQAQFKPLRAMLPYASPRTKEVLTLTCSLALSVPFFVAHLTPCTLFERVHVCLVHRTHTCAEYVAHLSVLSCTYTPAFVHYKLTCVHVYHPRCTAACVPHSRHVRICAHRCTLSWCRSSHKAGVLPMHEHYALLMTVVRAIIGTVLLKLILLPVSRSNFCPA
jgi:hypothetical protein